MNHRCLGAACTMIVVGSLLPAFATAQATGLPRTPWGDPDLQGVWDYRTITPLQRPEGQADKGFLTEEEAAILEQDGRRGVAPGISDSSRAIAR